MARTTLVPRPTAREHSVTVSWVTNGRKHHQCCINLSTRMVHALGLQHGDRAQVDICPETNRVWVIRAPHGGVWAVTWKQTIAQNACAVIRLGLPDIHGDKREAVPCPHRLTEKGELEIDMPPWAQPPRYRRATLERVA